MRHDYVWRMELHIAAFYWHKRYNYHKARIAARRSGCGVEWWFHHLGRAA